VIAIVAGNPISRAALKARFEEVRRGPMGRHLPPQEGPATANVRRWIARELVNEAILMHEAGVAAVAPSSIDVERLVADVTRDVAVTEDDVRAYYERNPDLYRRAEARRIRHAILPDEIRARRAIELMAGDAPAEGGAGGGSPTSIEVHRGEFAGALEEALFQAAVGTTVGPIRTELGWHVARVEAVIPESRVPYALARVEIEMELLIAARIQAFDAWLAQRRDELAVFEAEFEHPGHPIHGLASHRH
jgi:[acyl-carrier-protein] S-malonyltransferase